MSYYLYILESLEDGSYYVGSTQDLPSRIERHNQGRVKYTRTKRPWKIAYSEKHPDRSSAMKREYALKGRKSKASPLVMVRTSRQV
jgi:putative endonuclease